MKEIIAALSAIHESGFFVGKNNALAETLSLEVKGLGLLKWPLSKKVIQQLISLAKPAHFGWRDKTLLDKNVRDVWEISPKEIQIDKTVFNKTLIVMQELIHSAEPGDCPLPVLEIIRSLLSLWLQYMQYRSEDDSLLSQILQIACLIKNAQLSEKILQHFAIQVLTSRNIKLCLPLIEEYGVSWFLNLMHHWAQPKDKWGSVKKCKQISQVVKILAKNNSHRPLIHFLLDYQWRQLQKQYIQNKGITYRAKLSEFMLQLIQDFQELLRACRIIQQEDLMLRIVNHISSDKRCYPVSDLIVLLDDCEKSGYEILLDYIRSELQKESNLGLRQQDDWSIHEEISCQCADCAVLKQFLQSGAEKEKVWPLAQGRRQHIHQAIESLGIPVTHRTQHIGSPHKLILTKTELLHSQAKARFIKIKKELLFLGTAIAKVET